MAQIIELVLPDKPALPKTYSVDISKHPDNLVFTVKGIPVSAGALSKIADELEKIAQIIRTDVVLGLV